MTASTHPRFTCSLASAKPGRFGSTKDTYLSAEKEYYATWATADWSVLATGGGRLAVTRADVTDVVTTVGDLELTKEIRRLVDALTGDMPTGLRPLARLAAGTPLDLPRLARHIWDTGTDPWDATGGATATLAELSRITVTLPVPVRATIADLVLDPWSWFGPVLVAGTCRWIDNHTADDDSAAFDMSAVLAAVDDYDVLRAVTDLEMYHDPAAALSYLDKAAQQMMEQCDLEEGVTITFPEWARPALRNWVAVHRPHLLAQVDATIGVRQPDDSPSATVR